MSIFKIRLQKQISFTFLLFLCFASCKKEDVRYSDNFDLEYYKSIRWQGPTGSNMKFNVDSGYLSIKSVGHSESQNGLPQDYGSMFFSYGFEDLDNGNNLTGGALTNVFGDFRCSLTVSDFEVEEGNGTFLFSILEGSTFATDYYNRPDSNQLNGNLSKFGFFLKNEDNKVYRVGYFTEDASHTLGKNQFFYLFDLPYDKVQTPQADGNKSFPFTFEIARNENELAFNVVDTNKKLYSAYFNCPAEQFNIGFSALLDDDITKPIDLTYKISNWSLTTASKTITDEFLVNSVYGE